MSKRGWPELRRAVCLAAVCGWHADPEISIHYWARREEDKHPRVAAGAVAQPLLHTGHSAWALEQPHNPGCKSRSPGSVNRTLSSAAKVQAHFLPRAVHGTFPRWLCLDRKKTLQQQVILNCHLQSSDPAIPRYLVFPPMTITYIRSRPHSPSRINCVRHV